MRRIHLASVVLFALAISVHIGCTESRDAQTANGPTGGAPSIAVPLPGVDDGNRTCIGVVPERTTLAPVKGVPITGPTTPGSLKPTWTLKDVQPQSCGANQTYGLDAFDGKPLMVVLLWGGCGFCQSQAEKLQQMHYELRAAGIDVNFVIVNQARGTTSFPEKFVERTYFPIFQDEPDIDAWGTMDGSKDDFYLYRSDGVLHKHLSITGDLDLTLSSNMPGVVATGYSNLKNELMELVDNDSGPAPDFTSGGMPGLAGQISGGGSMASVNQGGDSSDSGGAPSGEMTATGGNPVSGGMDASSFAGAVGM